MLDLERPRTIPVHERQVKIGRYVRPESSTWSCSIVPNPPGAILIVEYRGPTGPKRVDVLLDGVPAAEHPSIYVASEAPEDVTSGFELDFLFVLSGGHPQFDTVEVQWTDAEGIRQSFLTDAQQAADSITQDDVLE